VRGAGGDFRDKRCVERSCTSIAFPTTIMKRSRSVLSHCPGYFVAGDQDPRALRQVANLIDELAGKLFYEVTSKQRNTLFAFGK
jgi:hypothetical protein